MELQSAKWGVSVLKVPLPSWCPNSNHPDKDAAYLESVGTLMLLPPDSTLSELGQQPPWQSEKPNLRWGEERYRTFPSDAAFHHTQTGCLVSAAKSAVTANLLEGNSSAALGELMGPHASFVVTETLSNIASFGVSETARQLHDTSEIGPKRKPQSGLGQAEAASSFKLSLNVY